MKSSEKIELWKGSKFGIITLSNPHIPPSEGNHVIVAPINNNEPNAWSNPDLTGEAFRLAALVCKIEEELGLVPWFNLMANGNWGLLPGKTPFFHVHIYGRRKGKTWAQPFPLPISPDSFENDPMNEEEISALKEALRSQLSSEEF
ncbi:MAG TPA: hypothetical protein VEA37_15060 [Flavobacterium sp.]|nr:hypothetical protein [Flavobacterium sp.]